MNSISKTPVPKKTWTQIKLENYERRKKRRLENRAIMDMKVPLPPGWPDIKPHTSSLRS